MGGEEEFQCECRTVRKFSIDKSLVDDAQKKGIDVEAFIDEKLREAVKKAEREE